MRDDKYSSKGLETCEVLVCSVLASGMNHINNLKVKDIRVLILYHCSTEKLKRIPNKVELVGAVKYFFRKDWDGLVQIWSGVGCLL